MSDPAFGYSLGHNREDAHPQRREAESFDELQDAILHVGASRDCALAAAVPAIRNRCAGPTLCLEEVDPLANSSGTRESAAADEERLKVPGIDRVVNDVR